MRDVFKAQPDPWQDDVLQAFPHFPRQAMKASKGPGKTCTLAWLCWNFLLTRANANIAATSISGDNLRDGLWKEMAVWQNKSDLLQRVFKWGVERIEHKEKPATWFMSARSWAKAASDEALGNTLAGLHMDHMMFVIDEAGGVPVAILQAAEAGLANAIQGTGKEAHLVIAGNTNMLDGSLYQACVKQRTMWHVTNITGDPDDPKRSSRVSIDWARELIKANGRDNPFVKVMVLGEWPPSSVNSLIGPDEVEQAMKRCYREFQYNKFAKILGVDVALDLIGSDASVIFPRQGMVAFPPIVLRGADSIQGAGAVARKWEDWGADACFVDATGGFGAGWIDQLRMLGKVPIGVKYSGGSTREGALLQQAYRNVLRRLPVGQRRRPVAGMPGAFGRAASDLLHVQGRQIITGAEGRGERQARLFARSCRCVCADLFGPREPRSAHDPG